MALKDEVPLFEKGSPELGRQLRELAAVVFKLCEAVEAASAAPAAPEPATTTKPTSAAAKRAAAK